MKAIAYPWCGGFLIGIAIASAADRPLAAVLAGALGGVIFTLIALADSKAITTALAFLLLAAPAWGAPVLMAEFRTGNSAGGILGQMPSTLPFALRAEGAGQWIDSVAPSQVGQVFTAPDTVVDSLRIPIVSSTFGAGICGDNCWDAPLDYWINKPDNAAPTSHTFHEIVPFRDYYLTGLTRTIESASITQFGTRWSFEGTQTIRFYGELSQPLPGDFNQNAEVDAADYVLWRNRFVPPLGAAGELPNESNQTENYIGTEDYQFWRSQFGHDSLPVGSALLVGGSIPEPSSLVILCILCACAATSRRR